MNDHIKLLKEILKSSHWTQEQLAARLGVSFATINSWLNGKTRPRESMEKKIEQLYLARDLTNEISPVYVTLVNIPDHLRTEDYVLLEKEPDNAYDGETIVATPVERGESDDFERVETEHAHTHMCVANSVCTVVRGTYSAGRVYDKITGIARAQIAFIYHRIAIARVVSWDDYERED